MGTLAVFVWKYIIGIFHRVAMSSHNPANIYLFKFNNRETKKRSGVCSKLIISNFDNISGLFLVSSVAIVHFE